MARLMDAAGSDYVLIETVGVGQDEVEIARLAQVTVVVLVPGMGDDVQAIKAGIMEIADIFVINKSDQPGADRVERELHARAAAHGPDRAHGRDRRQGHRGAAGRDRRRSPARARQAAAAAQSTIDHLGIAVDSLDAGARVLRIARPRSRASRDRGAGEGARRHAARRRFAHRAARAVRARFADRQFLEKRGPGLHHVALQVPDLRGRRRTAARRPARACSTSRAAARAATSTSSFTRLHRRRPTRTDSGERNLKAEIGIIGGSGLYSMPGFEAQEEADIETPFGAPSDNYVARHAGRHGRWRSWRGTAAAIASRPRS